MDAKKAQLKNGKILEELGFKLGKPSDDGGMRQQIVQNITPKLLFLQIFYLMLSRPIFSLPSLSNTIIYDGSIILRRLSKNGKI